MDFLKSTIPLIDSKDFGSLLKDSVQLQMLHEIVLKQKVDTDEEAMKLLYGKDGSPLAYKKLKQRLRDRLMDYVVHNGVTSKNLDDYAQVYRKCLNQTLAVKILMMSYARSASTYVAENLIRTTQNFEFTDLTLLLSRELFTYYSAISYHPRKSRKYERLMNESLDLFNKEVEVSQYYSKLRAAFSVSRGPMKEKVLDQAISYCKKIRPYLDLTNTSYQLLLNVYEIFSMRYEIAQDYNKLLEISEEALKVFKNRKIVRKYAFFRFDMNKIICNIQFGNNANVEALAESYFNEMTRGSLNWFSLKVYVFVSRLHNRNYQGAFDSIYEMLQSKNFDKLPGSYKQTLLVYEAHVEFLISIGKISSDKVSKFRLYKFLNEIPIYTKDKRGLNISILIVHVLFLLQQKKYSRIIDRVDALNQYCHRHLRRDETFRSNCFIKMLLQMAKANFNKKRTERYVQPYIKKLQTMPLVFSDQSIEVEIIPYEHLWSMVIELLD